MKNIFVFTKTPTNQIHWMTFGSFAHSPLSMHNFKNLGLNNTRFVYSEVSHTEFSGTYSHVCIYRIIALKVHGYPITFFILKIHVVTFHHKPSDHFGFPLLHVFQFYHMRLDLWQQEQCTICQMRLYHWLYRTNITQTVLFFLSFYQDPRRNFSSMLLQSRSIFSLNYPQQTEDLFPGLSLIL